MSKRWFKAVAFCHRFLAKPAVTACLRFSCALDRNVPDSIQAAPRLRMLVMVGAIAAAGRSGVEEMYCVQYLDVGCDVCCSVTVIHHFSPLITAIRREPYQGDLGLSIPLPQHVACQRRMADL